MNRIASRAVPAAASLAVLAAAVLSLASPDPAAAIGVPSPTTIVGGSGQSTQRDVLNPLAGSPDYLVYGRIPVTTTKLADGSDPFDDPMDALVVKSATGSPTVLARLTAADVSLTGWSMAGTTVTAVDSANPTQVHWWDATSHAQGVMTVPTNRYVSAAPGGVLWMLANGDLVRGALTGGSTILDRPFPARPTTLSVAVDTSGVVLGTGGGLARYVAFAAPQTVRHLRTGTKTAVACGAVSARYAACLTGRTDEGRLTGAALIALDGAAPVKADDPEEFAVGGVGLSGTDRLVWQRFGHQNAKTVPPIVLASRSATSDRVTVGETAVSGGDFVSALGSTIASTTAGHRILTTTDGNDVKTLVTAARARTTVSTFALTPDRVVDIDDADGDGSTATSVSSRSVSAATSTLDVGASHPVAHSADGRQVLVGQVVASGTTTAYETASSLKSAGPSRLHVVTATGTTVIPGVRPEDRVSLSGPWLVYRTNVGGKAFADLHVRNVVTGRDRVIGGYGEYSDVTVSDGHLLAANRVTGRVVWIDIKTGAQRRLSPALPQGSYESIHVFAWGTHVAWEITRGRSTGRFTDRLLDTSTTHAAITLDQRVIGLSSAGALLSTKRPPLGDYLQPQAYGPTTISLRTWAGATSQVLSPGSYLGVPQAAGHLLAWVSPIGVLQATRLP